MIIFFISSFHLFIVFILHFPFVPFISTFSISNTNLPSLGETSLTNCWDHPRRFLNPNRIFTLCKVFLSNFPVFKNVNIYGTFPQNYSMNIKYITILSFTITYISNITSASIRSQVQK